MLFRSTLVALGALALASCQQAQTPPAAETPAPQAAPDAAIFPPPTENYACEDGTRLAVRLLGQSAEVAVNGEPAMTLPQIASTSEQTTFSNGTHSLHIQAGRVSWAVGRAMPSPCTAS